MISQFIAVLGPVAAEIAVQALLSQQTKLKEVAANASSTIDALAKSKAITELSQPQQMSLPFEITP